MKKLFEKDEEETLEDEKDISKAVQDIKNIEGFVEPEKPDMSQFDDLAKKTEAVIEKTSKFGEDPRFIMKELDKMKNILNF